MQILDSTHTRMQRSTQGRVLMELALIRIANLDHFHQISTLLDQLRSGNAALPAAATVKSVTKTIAPPQPNKAGRIGLADITDDRARSAWFDAAESIPGVLGSMALKCKSLRLEKPNVFIATFDSTTAKEFCEKGSAQLQGVLSQSVGEAVKVRLELDIPESAPAEHVSSHQADRERNLAAMENPLVVKIQKTFGVTLQKVER
jgi:hypothetical protein